MLLFTHFLKKYSPWLIICVGVLLYATHIWDELPPPQLRFTRIVEAAAAAFAVVPISLILYEPTEIELGLACGIRTARFAFTRFIPCLLYTLVPATVISALYNYVPRITDPEYIGIVPIYVPGNYRLLLAVRFKIAKQTVEVVLCKRHHCAGGHRACKSRDKSPFHNSHFFYSLKRQWGMIQNSVHQIKHSFFIVFFHCS